MTYTPTVWVDYTTPCIDAAHLNKMEHGIDIAQGDIMLLRGLAVAKPASDPELVGRLYIETDSPYKVWRDNGITWDEIYISAGIYNVKSYGAVGDGVTDDKAAIEAAINAATVNGGMVYCPDGTYALSNSISVKSKVRLCGAGNTIIKFKDNANMPGAPVLLVLDAASSICIEHLILDGNRAAQTAGGDGIEIQNTSGTTADITIRDVTCKDNYRYGMRIMGSRVLVDDCTATNCGLDGFLVAGTIDGATARVTEHIRFMGCLSFGHVAHFSCCGFKCRGASKAPRGTLVRDVAFTNCHTWGNGINGLAGGGGFVSQAGDMFGADVGAMNNEIACKDIHWAGCHVFGTADTGWWVSGTQDWSLTAFSVDGNVGGAGIVMRGWGIEIQGASNGTIANGTIHNVGDVGLVIHGGDGVSFEQPVRRIMVDNVIVDTCGYNAMWGPTTVGVIISQDNDAYTLTDVQLNNCVIHNSAENGISILYASYVGIHNCRITDNGAAAAPGNTYGIKLWTTLLRAPIVRLEFKNNTIRDTRVGVARTQTDGINDAGVAADFLHISGNLVINNSVAQIVVVGANNTLADNVVV